LLITFAKKWYVPSETYINTFYAGYHQNMIFRGDFLFVRGKRHARVRSVFFFKSSHGVGRLFTYEVQCWWSYLAKQVLHLKMH